MPNRFTAKQPTDQKNMPPRADAPPPVTLAAARAYAARGWPVFPTRGKVPTTPRGCLDATRDPAELAQLWGSSPTYGVALATGRPSGVWVLDVDGREGADALRALVEAHGELPRTVTARTGGGGWHLFFRLGARDVRNSAGKVAPKVDVRGTGGYVVLPPSPHPSGRSYRWMEGRGPEELALADPPSWLLALVAPIPAHTGPPPSLRHLASFRAPGERDRVVSALDALTAALAYDEWIRVGMALHEHDPGPDGFQLWNTWSAGAAEKYPGEAQLRKHWRSFGPGSVTLGTLFHLAAQVGWTDPGKATPDLRSTLYAGGGR